MTESQEQLAKLCEKKKEEEECEHSHCLECTKCRHCGLYEEGYENGRSSGKILGRNLAFLEIKDFLVNSTLLPPADIIQQIKEKVK